MPQKRQKRNRGSVLISSIIVLGLLAVGTASYVTHATQSVRTSARQTLDVTASHLCEAGTQSVLRQLWRPFKVDQDFAEMDSMCSGASQDSPVASNVGSIDNVGKFSAGIISYTTPNGNTYAREVVVRSVGYFDANNNNRLDAGEARKVVDVTARYELARSQVFDYTYFVNNYGWMDGFGPNDLIVNGDMRANGNFQFLNGSPTVNGSVYASVNDKLVPAAVGLINTGPVKWANSTYATRAATDARMRPSYSEALVGAIGSATHQQWQDFVFNSTASVANGRFGGALLGDAAGYRGWDRTSTSATATNTVLDSTSTKEVVMPDLNDLEYYKTQSNSYSNKKTAFKDGTANPNANQGAYVETWSSSQNKYVRLSTNGVITGSAILVGTTDKPIKINGPVTITQDAVIKGTIEGQGTIYTGRNVHIVGSITYKNPPDFRGTNMTSIDNSNEKRDFLGLAARSSVIFGNPKTFANPYPLKYMTPPFTKDRYDEAGNLIPAYDATKRDSTGTLLYKSVLGDSALDSISSGINQVDAVIYTNFVGGGNLGSGGGGVKFNGTIISRDEAMVIWSLPVIQNYDNRIRERQLTQQPLIDLMLPRSPILLRSTWRDRGFSSGD